MQPAVTQLVQTVAAPLVALLASALAAFAMRLLHSLTARAEASKWKDQFGVLSEAVGAAVDEIAQKHVPGMQADSPDGKLTEAQQQQLVQMAIERALKLAGNAAAKAAQQHGATPALAAMVESKVAQRKAASVPPQAG